MSFQKVPILVVALIAGMISCSREDVGFEPPAQYGDLYIHGYYQMIGPDSRSIAIRVKRDQFVLCSWGNNSFPENEVLNGYFDAKTATFYFPDMPAVVLQAAGFDNAWSLHYINDEEAMGDFRKVLTWGEAVEYAPQTSACKSEPSL